MPEPSIRIAQRCSPEEEAAMVAAIMMFENDCGPGPRWSARPALSSGR
jgi:hypothetical protein